MIKKKIQRIKHSFVSIIMFFDLNRYNYEELIKIIYFFVIDGD